MKAPTKSPESTRGFAPVILNSPWPALSQTDATGKPSVIAPPAREFRPQHRNPMRKGTREQGGLSYLPSSRSAVNRSHEGARIGGRCASGGGVGSITMRGSVVSRKRGGTK